LPAGAAQVLFFPQLPPEKLAGQLFENVSGEETVVLWVNHPASW
jgi:hypothetical protein